MSDLRNCGMIICASRPFECYSKYAAQDSVSGNDEDDMQVIPEPNSQDEMDAAFLADVRTYGMPKS